MTVIDLSHTIHEGMPVFPGMSQPKTEKAFRIETHGFAETQLSMLSHTGTHMDAPAHMKLGGKSLDSYPASHFIGRALVLDAKSPVIELSDIKEMERRIQGIDFVLLRTNWSQLWGKDEYFKGFPALSVDAANWLTASGMRGIGLDCISADVAESTDFPIHHILFNSSFVIVENLTNLDKLPGEVFMFSCLPIKYEDADGSPVRAIAWY